MIILKARSQLMIENSNDMRPWVEEENHIHYTNGEGRNKCNGKNMHCFFHECRYHIP